MVQISDNDLLNFNSWTTAKPIADWTPDGGCLEAAQAATELRNTEPRYTRRSVLTTMTGLGAATVAPDGDRDTVQLVE